MKHDYYHREDDLLHCKVCNGGEGTLPTHCPGMRMTDAEEEAVYAGKLEYLNGKWWEPAVGVALPAAPTAAVLRQVRDVLNDVRGNINPERGYADELEADVVKAIALIDAFPSGVPEPVGINGLTEAETSATASVMGIVAEALTCWGLSSFCAEVGHKCRASGACVYAPPASGVRVDDRGQA